MIQYVVKPTIFHNMISGKQLKAGRVLLGYSADTIARRVGAKAHQVYRVEQKAAPTLAARLAAELEANGIRFIGNGVILQEDTNARRS
jgi:hypothetical protein